jgi:heme-binding protein
MSRRLKQIAVIFIVFIVVVVTAQLIRPGLTNPPIDPTRTIEAHMSGANGLASVLNRSCGDCHSNDTRWPWYAHVAPASWLMAYGVNSGRKAVNFSDWASYPPDQQRKLLSDSCNDASTGKMPGVYTLLRPETRLSASDIETICAAAHQARQGASR